MGILSGMRAVVTGVANKRSIAWGIAQAFDREGAELVLTYQSERLKENVDKLIPELARPPHLLQLDVSNEDSLAVLRRDLGEIWGDRLDVVVHSMAYAERKDLEGRFVDTSREGFHVAQDISAYSLTALTRAVSPLLETRGGSVMALTYEGSQRVLPHYNVMGVAKASLEASMRYLAFDMGKQHIRVNAISAGPLKTLASSAVKGISSALHDVADKAPIPENITIEDVGNAAVFLASPWSKMITGNIIYVDSGMHIMGVH